MNIKVVYNNEIHRINKLPGNMEALKNAVRLAFNNHLPEPFTMQYDDSDGDRIMLCDNSDYDSLVDELSTSKGKKQCKVYIVPFIKNVSQVKEENLLESISKSEKSEEYQVLAEPESKVEEKVEVKVEDVAEIIEKKVEEVPVVEEKANPTDKEAMMKMLADTFLENLPYFASLTQEFITKQMTELSQVSVQKVEEKQLEKEPESESESEYEEEEEEEEENESEAEVVHHNYVCDGCGQDGIVGIRYRCVICDDFDYCEECEETKGHPHIFLKIRQPTNVQVKVEIIPEPENDVKCLECTEVIRAECPEEKKEKELLGFLKKMKEAIKNEKNPKEKVEKAEEKENKADEKVEKEEIKEVIANEMVVEAEEVVEEKIEIVNQKYSGDVLEKGEKLYEMFGMDNKDEIFEFIAQNPGLKMEELVESYLLQL